MEGIGRQFLEKTQYKHLGPSAQERGEPQPPLEVHLGDGPSIALPDPQQGAALGETSLRAVIEARHSLREYAEAPLSLEELGYLLWATQGITRVVPDRATFRTVPSAGARHAFETIVVANRVDGLDPAAYQYRASDHQLIQLDASPQLAERLTKACLGQPFVATSAVTFAWAAIWERMAWRYGERSARYLFVDAGHVCQNLYLAAESIGCGACAIGAFDDEITSTVLGLDGIERFVVYLATVGKRAVSA